MRVHGKYLVDIDGFFLLQLRTYIHIAEEVARKGLDAYTYSNASNTERNLCRYANRGYKLEQIN